MVSQVRRTGNRSEIRKFWRSPTQNRADLITNCIEREPHATCGRIIKKLQVQMQSVIRTITKFLAVLICPMLAALKVLGNWNAMERFTWFPWRSCHSSFACSRCPRQFKPSECYAQKKLLKVTGTVNRRLFTHGGHLYFVSLPSRKLWSVKLRQSYLTEMSIWSAHNWEVFSYSSEGWMGSVWYGYLFIFVFVFARIHRPKAIWVWRVFEV